jgi:hypothetical protein
MLLQPHPLNARTPPHRATHMTQPHGFGMAPSNSYFDSCLRLLH